MKLPYGIADFHALRTEGYRYVDRSAHLRTIEEAGKALLFLRPRRFGKSLWLRTLACYYDLRTADEHQHLFGDLAIGRDPTPLAHRFFVMPWDFSDVDPDPSPLDEHQASMSRVERLDAQLHGYLNTRLEIFLSDYREHLPERLTLGSDAFQNLGRLLGIIRRPPYRLYLLIDEYDNFANEVMTASPEIYQELLHADGPFKRLFKWVKAAAGGQGLERLFFTGVSPIVMSDLTSGLNIAKNVYLYPELNDLCGFTETEIRDLLEDLRDETPTDGSPAWTVDGVQNMMRQWYDGYRFALGAERIYNPTLVLYFLDHLQRTGEYPRQMLDSNLAVDEDKLEYLGRAASGRAAVIDVIRNDGDLEIQQLQDRFTLRSMLDLSGEDADFLGSYLYYFGMLTLAGETEFRTLRLVAPNQVVKKLYAERIQRFLLPSSETRTASARAAQALWQNGDPEPLLDFIE